MADPGRVVQRVFGNVGRLLGGKAGAGVLSLAYMVVAARALGRGDYGVLVLVHTYVTAVAGLIEFPGWHAIVRYGSVAEAEGDARRLARLLGFAAVLELACGAIAVVAAAMLAPLVGPKLGWSAQAVAFAAPYSLAALGTVRATPAGYLQLTGRFDLLGLHNLAAPLTRLIGAVIVVVLHAGLTGFLVAWLVAALVEWSSLWIMGLTLARRRVRFRDAVSAPSLVVGENPGLVRFMLGANADVTLSELSGRLTPLAVGWLLGPAAAGLYAVGQRVTAVITQPALILGQASYAEFARLAAQGGPELPAILRRMIVFGLLAAAPVCLVIALVGGRLAALVGGASFAAAGAIMLWLAIGRAIQIAAPPLSAALTALGRPGISVLANTVSGFAPLLALPLLVRWQGLTGVGLQAVLQAVLAVGLLALGFSQAVAGRGQART